MANFLVMVAAMMAVSSWAGGGDLIVAAQGAPLFFMDEIPMPGVITKTPPPCLSHNTVGGDLCEDDPEYNDTIKHHIKRLLSRDRGVNTLLGDPSLRSILNDVIEPKASDTIGTRFGGDTETPVCAAQETLVYPKRGKTQKNEWVFVLNQEDVQQALRVEKCINDGSSCGVVLPKDAKATCRQKYIYRRLLVLGTNKIEPEEVLMPSCCVCYTTYQGLTTRSRNATFVQSPPAPAPQPSAVDTHSGISAPLTSGPAPSPSMGFAFRSPLSSSESRSIRYRSFYPYP